MVQPTVKDPRPPSVSVIMPAWNRERSIGEAILSILRQTFEDLEVIVVDDGSTDGTAKVVSCLSDARVRYLRREHAGISAAMNSGLDVARGKFVARLDSDDLWLPDMLATLVPVLEDRPEIGLVYARAAAMDAGGNPLPSVWGIPLHYPGDTFRSMVYGDSTCNITVVARRECFDRAGRFDESLRASEDWDMWLRIARHHEFVFVDRVVARFRLHEGSITHETAPGRDQDLEQRTSVLDKLYATPELPERIMGMQGIAYSNVHTGNGLLWFGERKYRKAFAGFARAVRMSTRPGFTLARILWFTFKWQVLDRHPVGRRLAARAAGLYRRWGGRAVPSTG